MPDGTLALAGQVAVQGQGDPWLARVDRWGNTLCNLSGKCLATPDLDCADGNSCTADWCQAGQCSHVANAVGAGCGGKGQCKGTTCENP